MSAPSTPEIERLLAPISADAPAGASLRHDGVYDKIREARREDDASLPQGVWQRPLKIADYGAVVSLAEGAIERRSKDLQVAAWLGDAWAHLHGLAGVAAALGLVAGLVERYWDGLFPELDDGDDEARARVLDWLDEALSRRLLVTKLGDERASITYGDWERAGSEVEAEEEPAATREALLARMSLVDGARWGSIRATLRAAGEAAAGLERALGAQSKESPHRTADLLRGMESLVAGVLRETESKLGVTEVADAPAAREEPRADGSGGALRSRAEAYRRLEEAADYLMRTEPHSPVPYLIKRAISWGNMPLTELLPEFVSSADDLVAVHRLLGMRPREG
jgi:type VI secretion system protein ImpA